MKRKNDATNINDLIDGCYHELGHIIATLIYFQDGKGLKGLSFNPNIKYPFSAAYNDYQWTFPNEVQAFFMITIGGGVFQQMHHIQEDLSNGRIKYSVIDKLINIFSPQRALIRFFSKRVTVSYPGMEADIKEINDKYDIMLRAKSTGHPRWANLRLEDITLDSLKVDAIKLFLPFLQCKKVKELCVYCSQIIKSKIDNGDFTETLISTEQIKGYLFNKSSV